MGEKGSGQLRPNFLKPIVKYKNKELKYLEKTSTPREERPAATGMAATEIGL